MPAVTVIVNSSLLSLLFGFSATIFAVTVAPAVRFFFSLTLNVAVLPLEAALMLAPQSVAGLVPVIDHLVFAPSVGFSLRDRVTSPVVSFEA